MPLWPGPSNHTYYITLSVYYICFQHPLHLYIPPLFFPFRSCTWCILTTSHTIRRSGDKWRGWEMCMKNERNTVSAVWGGTWGTPWKWWKARHQEQTAGNVRKVSVTACLIRCFCNENATWKSEPDPQLICRDREIKEVVPNRSLRLEFWLLACRHFSTTGLKLHNWTRIQTHIGVNIFIGTNC